MGAPTRAARRGTLVSIEGLSGVGKTYLTQQLLASLPPAQAPVVLEAFTQRRTGTDLGRSLLRALITASGGDRFLRGGHPHSETLLLLAVKLHDFETSRATLDAGHTVIEGRSLHSTATYQALIVEHHDDRALTLARRILTDAAVWRPLPDLTVIITDDPAAALRRAEQRDHEPPTPEQRQLHLRAAALFELLAHDDPDHVRILDRRRTDTENAVATLSRWITEAPQRSWANPHGVALPWATSR